jgi:putative nucleotidyltransferase with HDIG domain
MAVRMLEAKDPYTRGHSTRVADYAVGVGQLLGFGPVMLDALRLGGELHDIGKIGTRDAVLNKPGKLTTEEFEEIKRHTTDGAEMLSVLGDEHPEVLRIVRSHHERFDGSGFPDGLRGTSIPQSARIVAVVDAFDAMTSNRAYRDSQDHRWAYGELTSGAGSHFDPDLVNAFIAAFPPPNNSRPVQ